MVFLGAPPTPLMHALLLGHCSLDLSSLMVKSEASRILCVQFGQACILAIGVLTLFASTVQALFRHRQGFASLPSFAFLMHAASIKQIRHHSTSIVRSWHDGSYHHAVCSLYPRRIPTVATRVQAVYTTLREAEYRSTAFIPYWNFAPLRAIVPRQRRCTEALGIVNTTLDGLISKCKRLVMATFCRDFTLFLG